MIARPSCVYSFDGWSLIYIYKDYKLEIVIFCELSIVINP